MKSLGIIVGLACLMLAMGGNAVASTTLADIRAMMDQGQSQQARAALDDYLATNPDDPKARFLKGLVLARLDQRAAAIELFKGLVRDYPELPEPYNNLAVLYAADGDYEQARDALLKAINTHPSYATAHENLGDIYARMAASAYDHALTLDEQNATAEAKLALVNELFPTSPTNGAGQTTGPVVEMPIERPVAGGPEAETRAVLLELTRAWAGSWSAQDVGSYLDFYAIGFQPDDGMSLERWAAERRRRLTRPKFIEVTIEDAEVERTGNDEARVSFVQSYRSDSYRDRVRKTLSFVREDGRWKIGRERSAPL